MINFNKNSIFNLHLIDIENVRKEVEAMLVADEEIVMAFKTIRDQLVFTNKRIISIDVQGLTGLRKSFTTLPYHTIQYFAVQTPGFLEVFPDTEMLVMFASGFTAKFEFKSNVDIALLTRTISEGTLGDRHAASV